MTQQLPYSVEFVVSSRTFAADITMADSELLEVPHNVMFVAVLKVPYMRVTDSDTGTWEGRLIVKQSTRWRQRFSHQSSD
jgi:hypothetical protein